MSRNAAGIGLTDPREFARPAQSTATDFNPFNALGVPAAVMDETAINSAFRLAHRHLIRLTSATPTAGAPTSAQLNLARDALSAAAAGSQRGFRYLVQTWANSPRTFFAERPIGDATVFVAPPATATAASTAPPTPGAGSSAANPWTVDSDDEDVPPPAATPAATPAAASTPSRRRPAAPSSLATAAPAMPGTPATPTPSPATPTPTSSSRRRPDRSAGASQREAAAANPNPDNVIVVGEWRRATATPPNAVTARFDARGRLNYRIIARSVGGQPVAAPTATAVGAANIRFVPPFAGLSPSQIHALLDQMLNQNLIG